MRQHSTLFSGQIPELLDLSRKAGVGIMDIYRQISPDSLSVSLKDDDSPLTQADLRAHEILLAGLTRLTPEIPVVSEEDEDSLRHRTTGSPYWLIDPLDGTREFIARNGEFTVNVALVAEGAPLFGMVYAPALDLLYWGSVDTGAFRQGATGRVERIAVAGSPRGRTIRVVASKSHLNAETTRFIAKLGAHELVQAGSSLKFCRVAEGAADVYPRLGPTSEWDTAAAQAIVEAAGGQVATLDGARLAYSKADILNPFFVASAVPLSELPRFHD